MSLTLVKVSDDLKKLFTFNKKINGKPTVNQKSLYFERKNTLYTTETFHEKLSQKVEIFQLQWNFSNLNFQGIDRFLRFREVLELEKFGLEKFHCINPVDTQPKIDVATSTLIQR